MNLTKNLDLFQQYSQFENSCLLCLLLIVHFAVTDGNEAGDDLAFIRAFLLYYVKVFLCKLAFLSTLSMREGGRFVSKQGQSQPRFHPKARILSLTTVKWYSLLHATSPMAPNFIYHITADLNVLYYFMPFPSTPVRTLEEILVLQNSLL